MNFSISPESQAPGTQGCSNRSMTECARLVGGPRSQGFAIAHMGDMKMDEDEKLAADESERAAQHQAVKGEARQEMQAEIARHTQQSDEQKEQAAAIGEHLKEKAIRELIGTEAEIERARIAARASQVFDYIFYIIYSLIVLEILLDLIGARESNAFKNFIDAMTSPLLAPFKTLVPDIARGRFELKISYLFALIVYVLLHLGVNGLLRLLAHRKTAI